MLTSGLCGSEEQMSWGPGHARVRERPRVRGPEAATWFSQASVSFSVCGSSYSPRSVTRSATSNVLKRQIPRLLLPE